MIYIQAKRTGKISIEIDSFCCSCKRSSSIIECPMFTEGEIKVIGSNDCCKTPKISLQGIEIGYHQIFH